MSPESATLRPVLSDAARTGILRVIAIVSWVIIGLSLALLLTYEYGADQGIFALVGRTIVEGGVPYRDAFDIKPPGVFFVYAFAQAVFGPAHVGIRILECGAVLACTAGMMLLSRRYWGTSLIGLVAGALSAMTVAQHEFASTAQAESFGATLTVWTLVAASMGVDAVTARRKWGAWLMVGLLTAFAALLKPTMALPGPLFALIATIWKRQEDAPADRLIPLAGTVLGIMPPVLATVLWFAHHGALAEMYRVLFVFNAQYAKLAWRNASLLSMTYRGVTMWLTKYSSAFLVGLAALLWFRPRREERSLVLAILATLVVQLAGIIAQGRLYAYHWNVTFPLTAMLAALGLTAAARRAAQYGFRGVVGYALVLPIVLVASAQSEVIERSMQRWGILIGREYPQATLDRLASNGLVGAALDREAATYIQAHTPEDSAIYVWGFYSSLYERAGRRPGSRFIHNQALRAKWESAGVRATFLQDLAQTTPAAIVVEKGDRLEAITGVPEDSAQAIDGFPAFKALLENEYRPGMKNRLFDVYLRRDLARDNAGSPPANAAKEDSAQPEARRDEE